MRNLTRVHLDPYVRDFEIQSWARQALRDDPLLAEQPLEVVVRDGRDLLGGRVPTVYLKYLAESAVARVEGVSAVQDDVLVVPTTTPATGAKLRTDILAELSWNPYLQGDAVEVNVEGSAATLRGFVRSPFERRVARRAAREGGATQVRDELRLRAR